MPEPPTDQRWSSDLGLARAIDVAGKSPGDRTEQVRAARRVPMSNFPHMAADISVPHAG